MIKYSNIKKGNTSINDISNILKEKLELNSYFHFNDFEIVYDCLCLFNFKNVEKTKKSVTHYSLKVLNAVAPEFQSLSEKPIKSFLLLFLNIKKLPLSYKFYLETKSKQHFNLVQSLLKHYEAIDFIQDFVKNGQKARSHHQATVIEFYKRTLNKSKKISDYIIYFTEVRAIHKATERSESLRKDLGDLFERMEYYTDFPYLDLIFDIEKGDWTHAIDLEKLDYRKINRLSHKIQIVGKINSKKDVDKQIIKLTKPTKVFNEIILESKNSPILKERFAVFKELKQLFRNKMWYGFYALGLPQIEGIFNQMNGLLKQKSKTPNSLPGKVSKIREQFYKNEDYYYNFDYYEFYLPNQRNKFSHSGNDSNIKEKAYSLLIDLKYLIKIVGSLDAPVIQLANILKQGDNYFRSVVKFEELFNLVYTVKKNKHFQLIKKQYEIYIDQKFCKNIDLIRFIDLLDTDLKEHIPQFVQQFDLSVYVYNKTKLSFNELSKKEIVAKMDVIIPAIQTDWMMILHQYFKFFNAVNVFINNIPKVINDPVIIERIKQLKLSHSGFIEKIRIINSKLESELSDNITMLEINLKHSMNYK